MKKRAATIVMVLLGSVMALVVIGIGVVGWIFVSVIDRDSADEPEATRAFNEVRARFDKAGPVIRLEEDGPVVLRKPPTTKPAGQLSSLNVLAWDRDDGKLVKATLPFWLLRLKSGPIELSEGRGIHIGRALKFRVSDVERYGPSLLIDERHGSDRVLVWTD